VSTDALHITQSSVKAANGNNVMLVSWSLTSLFSTNMAILVSLPRKGRPVIY